MNAAEKALQAKNREQEARIMKVFEEAHMYRKESIEWYDDDSNAHYDARKSAFKKAVKLFTKCAKSGHVESMECLGDLYYYGSFDQRKSAFWYEQAAVQGSVRGMKELIWRYESGYGGVVKSEAMALKWKGLLHSRLDELYDEAMQKYTECKENYKSYANGAKPDESELNSRDRTLLYEAIGIFEKCAKYEHVKSMKVLEEICRDWLHDGSKSLHWYFEQQRVKK